MPTKLVITSEIYRTYWGRVASQGAAISVPGDYGLTPTNGLAGTETAINDGLIAARKALQQNTQAGVDQLSPFAETGVQANQKLAAYQGLLGPEAQAQAFAEYQASPEQQYLLEPG